MSLLEHYIVDVISVTDVTTEYEKGIRRFEPDYHAEEVIVRVALKEDCYGQSELVKKIWRKSEWEKIKEQGFYMA